ncbi:hypothetical protein GOP47_0014578 [Adiantum capillus-veneris]|uniref:FK506-binding protein n=1 Tax=Adiantum capillus-veneris TaxID=13818 RepID=A0A9D4ULY2_ADICA|nr:hypothetical protein GOP47_0014578 [Adiantum capillus-veneris]
MAFWGVEVKPRKSYTLKFSDFQAPRLHLSQATLGNRKSDDRTIVRCSVAESPFVYVCSLLPGVAETCTLDLFFDDDVTFSVKGSSSVHLVGYFDGVFDGNESGEDVEDDGYSDEEEEEEEESDSFIVSDDDDYDDEDDDDDDWFGKEDDTRVPNTGVTIEELPDDTEVPGKSLVPVKKVAKHSEKNGPADVTPAGKTSNSKQTAVQSKQDNSSEDEDGFRVKRHKKQEVAVVDVVANEKKPQKQVDGGSAAAGESICDGSGRKRKQKEASNEPHFKKKSADVQVETPQHKAVVAEEHEMDTDSQKSKKKKKKKKKGKDASEDISVSPAAQANGSTLTPIKQADVQTIELKKDDPNIVDSNEKGAVRKHPNGLEIGNIKMGKPDGKQATPGKKIGMIYTGRLRSNEKIFDSNVGKKPFLFRLGVGEVIKGWDIGVNGMRVGDKRRLVIPPEMGYGSKGVPGIPPNSWLKFDVELVEVK